MEQLMKTNGKGDILSIVFKNIDTVELIRWYYHPQIKTRAYLDGVYAELMQRVNALDADNLEANKEALFEMYEQSQKGHAISDYLADKISNIVRTRVQQQVDEACRTTAHCDLSLTSPNAGILSNELLEVLAHFNKSIYIPSHVEVVLLRHLGLTSLWLRFTQDSKIKDLHLANNNFKEFNYRTFGQYIDGSTGEQLEYLSLSSNADISEINVDELMMPNIVTLAAGGCVSLSSIKNIPRSVVYISLPHTNFSDASQLQFQSQTGNGIRIALLNSDAAHEFEHSLKSVYPKWKSDCDGHGITICRSSAD